MYQRKTVGVLVGIVLFTAGAFLVWKITCSHAAENNPVASANNSSQSSYSAKLLAIAAEYRTWGRVDDEMRWAPELCRKPHIAEARFSKSEDSNDHGQKLYSLFALNRKDYLSLWIDQNKLGMITSGQESNTSKLGIRQALVKESWKPALVENQSGILPSKIEANRSDAPETEVDHFWPYAERDGKTYRADKKAGLFIMMQLESKTSDSDDGWVYGTVTADGKEVTSVGLVKSCMECHQNAPHGRLFGIDYHGM